MKTLFLTLFCTISFTFNTSASDNFLIKNGQVIWQKIYNTTLTKDQLIWNIRNSGNFKNISVQEDYLTAEISMLRINHFRYERLTGNYAHHIANSHHVNSYIKVEFKENRYRVTLKSIKLMPKDDEDDIIDMETFALKWRKEVFDSSFFRNKSKILDYAFKEVTDFKESQESDQW